MGKNNKVKEKCKGKWKKRNERKKRYWEWEKKKENNRRKSRIGEWQKWKVKKKYEINEKKEKK